LFVVLAVLAALGCLAGRAFAAPPTAPTLLRADATHHSSGYLIWRLNWQDNSTTETRFRFYLFWGGQYQGELDPYLTVDPVNNINNQAYTGPQSHFVILPSLVGNVQFYVSAHNQTTNEESTTTGYTLSNAPAWQSPSAIGGTSGMPTNVTAVPSPAGGDGAIRLTFTDNTNSELYYEVQYKKHSDPDSSYQTTFMDFNTSSADLAFYKAQGPGPDGQWDPVDDPAPDDELMFLPVFEPNTAYDVRVRTRGISTDFQTVLLSDWTAPVTATTTSFIPPSNLTAVRVGENKFNLSFTSNSTTKSGHKFQYRVAGTSTWLDLGLMDNPYQTTAVNTGEMAPGYSYEFQVCAYIRHTHSPSTEPVIYSAYSNTATASSIFNAPTGLTATAAGEGKVNLTWVDNSSAEWAYAVQAKVKGSSSQWLTFDYFNPNTTSATNLVLIPGATAEIRVVALWGSYGDVLSAPTNTAEVTTTFNAPTNFTATASATDPYRVSFSWTDNSAVETHHELRYRKVGDTSYATRKLSPDNGGTAPNSMSLANLPEFEPGSVYDFSIRAVVVAGNGTIIAQSNDMTATVTTLDGFSSKPYAPITMGTPFSYTMTTMGQQPRTDWNVGALPPGLTFDEPTGVISGTPTVSGLFMVPMTANFSGGRSHVLDLALRILRPTAAPQVAASIGQQNLLPGGTATVALDGKFSDLDTEAVMRLTTSKGDLDVVLFTTQTPATVANFRAYDYVDTIFHRAPTGFVMQGGGYKIGAPPDVFDSVTRQSPVANEPGISNLYATVAMAKVGDDPNSATSEFFFSLGNNSLNLDNQNGGFTVFGRLSGPSTNTLTALGAVPITGYAVKLREDGTTTPSVANFVFSDIPVDQSPAPSSIPQDKLMKITAVTEIPVLTYEIATQPDGSVAEATLNGTDLIITAVAPGTTSLTITATDIDANVTEQIVAIVVSTGANVVALDSATLTQVYDGTPREVTATTNPAGLSVAITYDGSSTPPTEVGSYAVVATVVDATYSGTDSGTLVIRGQTIAEWRAAKFTQQEVDDGLSADDADPDHDGLKNLAEYALGADPHAHTPPVGTPVRDGDGFSLTFTRPKGLPGVIYGAESSDSLTAESWTPLTVEVLTPVPPGPVETVRVRDPLNSGNLTRRFIRLLFQQAP